MEKSQKSISFYAKGFILIAIILLIWELAVRWEYIPELVFPRPSKVLIKGFSLITTKDFYKNIFLTLFNWFIALITGLTIGLIIGFTSGINKKIEQFILPISAFARSIPPIALFPAFLIIFGPGGFPIILAGILGGAIYVFPIASQSAEASKEKFQDLSIILNFSKFEFIKNIVIPATLISTIVSSRIAASYVFAVAIGGEIIIGGSNGIGAAIFEASEKYHLEEAYFYILFAGMLGLFIDLIFTTIQNNYSYKG